MHQMRLLLDERKALLDETHATMKLMDQQLLAQRDEMSRMRQSIDRDDQQRLMSSDLARSSTSSTR